MDALNIQIDHDEDGTCLLRAELQFKGFAGCGAAYFDVQSLKDAAAEFGQFPLDAANLPTIEGGYFHDDMSALKEVHLALKASPRGVTGRVVLQITLGVPTDQGADAYSAALKCEVPTTYAVLSALSTGLAELCIDQASVLRIEL